MKLSIGVGVFLWKHFGGERKMIEAVAKAGFDAMDYTFAHWLEKGISPWTGENYTAYAKETRQIVEDNGIILNQSHGPMFFDLTMQPDWNKELLPMNIRGLEACALLGIPHMVVHPLCPVPYAQDPEGIWKLNEEYFGLLQPYAKQFGVKICLENLFGHSLRNPRATEKTFCSNPYEYVRFYDHLNDGQNFICCVDTGHAGLAGEDAAETIRVLGRRVKALHINDNDFLSDLHWMPYHGNVDWDSVLHALADVGYDGDFTFELSSAVFLKYEKGFRGAALRHCHDIGRHMMGLIGQSRKESGS